ncbi:uncharacterized protein CC84DRAFT_1253722, partial [Paraphaeosphaeria sporulosa]
MGDGENFNLDEESDDEDDYDEDGINLSPNQESAQSTNTILSSTDMMPSPTGGAWFSPDGHDDELMALFSSHDAFPTIPPAANFAQEPLASNLGTLEHSLLSVKRPLHPETGQLSFINNTTRAEANGLGQIQGNSAGDPAIPLSPGGGGFFTGAKL